MARTKETASAAASVKPARRTTAVKAKTVTHKQPEPNKRGFTVWIVGDTPLICHAWSQKAKAAMLGKQQKEASEGLAARDPYADFASSLYAMSPETDDKGNDIPFAQRKFGFPITAVKKAMWSVAHKDRGVPRQTVKTGISLHAEMIRVGPALAGAICDMPLVRIYGSPPEMREDMVRVGVGLNKKSSLAYRAQFTVWAIRVRGRIDLSTCEQAWIEFLVRKSGEEIGIGDWRNEKDGVFGAYHCASHAEHVAWNAYMRGTGPLPTPAPWGGEFDYDDEEWEQEAAQ
jgi:hypothetical protein